MSAQRSCPSLRGEDCRRVRFCIASRSAAARRRVLISLAAALVFGACNASEVGAASLQWDNNGASPVNGGTGSWNTATALWFNGATFQTWSNVALDDAVFGAAAGTVTLATQSQRTVSRSTPPAMW